MAAHSSTLAWKLPWTKEPGRLQSMGSLSQTQLSDFTFTFHFHALEKAMAPHSSVLVSIRLSDFNNRNVFLTVVEGSCSRPRCWAELISSEASPWLAYDHLLTVSLHDISSAHTSSLVFLRTPVRLASF